MHQTSLFKLSGMRVTGAALERESPMRLHNSQPPTTMSAFRCEFKAGIGLRVSLLCASSERDHY